MSKIKYYLNNTTIALIIITVIIFFLFLIPNVSAGQIKYETYYSNWNNSGKYIYSQLNINDANYYPYRLTQDKDNYQIEREKEYLFIPKLDIEYDFKPERIEVTFLPNKIKIDTSKTSKSKYIVIPDEPLNKIIKWDDSAPQVKNATTGKIESLDYYYEIDSKTKEKRVYFDIISNTNISFNSYIINNVTTSQWIGTNVSNLNGSMITDNNTIMLQPSIQDGLVAYYGMDGSSGTSVWNSNNGNGTRNSTNAGTMVNMNVGYKNCTGNCSGWTNSTIGNSLAFDGVDDYIDISDSISLDIFSDKTISFWMKTNTNNGMLLEKYDSDTSESSGVMGYYIYMSSGQLRFQVRDIYGNFTTVQSTKYYNDNNFHLCVALINYTNKSIILNIDNGDTLITHSNSSLVFPVDTNEKLLLGKRNLGAIPLMYGGLIDEVRIYNRALSASEIATLYNTSKYSDSTIWFSNNSAVSGNRINTVTANFTKQDNSSNLSLWGRLYNSSTNVLISSNVSSGQSYSVPSTLYNKTLDLGVRLWGNGSNSVEFKDVSWTEINTPYIISAGWINGSNPWNTTQNFTVKEGTTIQFNFTPSQTGNYYNWTKDGIDQGTNSTYWNRTFVSEGITRNVTASVTNSNGSASWTWFVSIIHNDSYIPPVLPPQYAPESDVFYNIVENGDDRNLNWTDGFTENFRENNSAVPEIIFIFNTSSTTNASGTFNVTSNLWYETITSTTHYWSLRVKNKNNGSWITLFTPFNENTTCSGSACYEFVNITGLNNSDYRYSNGTIYLEWLHNTNGNTNHYLHIDEMKVTMTMLPITLSGYVFNTLSLPIQNARIDINNNSYTFSSIDGSYNISNLSYNINYILVRAIGYQNQTHIINTSITTLFNFTMLEQSGSSNSGIVSTPGFEGIITILILGILKKLKR